MAESKPSFQQSIASLKETLGRDGHLLENTLSLIVQQAATVRGLYPSLPDASFALMDAMTGSKRTRIPQAVVERLLTLAAIIDNNPLIGDAQNIGMASSPNMRKEIAEASKQDISVLRELVLRIPIPSEPGKPSVTIAEKIKALPPQR